MIPLILGPLRLGPVQKFNVFSFYVMGARIRALKGIVAEDPWSETTGTDSRTAIGLCKPAEDGLTGLIESELVAIRTAKQPAIRLRDALRKFRIDHRQDKGEVKVSDAEARNIASAVTDFETVFNAELGLAPLYIVSQKAAFDTDTLISNGHKAFPKDVAAKAPEAIADLGQATRCVVFELFTAAGFHLHRANESVLKRYWDAVSSGAERPKSGNMGDFLNAMQQKKLGNARTLSALKDLKDLHRNPLIHPEHSIENADEAIALMNAVQNAMTQMLKEMPEIPKEKLADFDDEIPF